MISLGIESTAHTFGVGIINDKKKILANVKDVFTTVTGGLIPAELGKHHVVVCDTMLKTALDTAKLTLQDIDIISYSDSPGIGNSLRVGCLVARTLSMIHKKPLVGVNHCVAHLEIGKALTHAKDPILLYASGANTQIIAFEGGKYRVFGETLDLGIGNCIDSIARELGLGFPGGPKIEALAKNSTNLIKLPYVVKGMDISLSGIFTNIREKIKSKKYTKEDLAFSLQEYVFAMLVEVSERAMSQCQKKELLLGGGVACNKRLQEMCKIMCAEREAKFFVPENQFLVDNGAMIAWTGLIMHKAGIQLDPTTAGINPYKRTDDVEVVW